ncbi:MAG: methanol--corrinoid methyltransferase [Planctomycetes bacterium]|nr:methanol--corrinoid methyltransferase [Planctomycetota bacterium]
MNRFSKLAITNPRELHFGVAPHPVTTRGGLVIGGGTVYPELNFTLPTMSIEKSTWNTVRNHYQQIAADACKRAAQLEAPGVVFEFETLPPMVERPEWGIELVRILLEEMQRNNGHGGLKTALRFTPNDLREMERPPLMRRGPLYENMLASFEAAAAAGADLLSIESVGGKEVCDDALTMCDIDAVIFALTILGARDMDFLWGKISDIASRHGAVCAGDTACGFANTAMVLAENGYIPRVFAAVVRAVAAVRSLVAYEKGAVGPGKDCGYENPFLKAITGCPMAMEGKTAACAHLSPVGNVAAATCDLWSNESVQNIKLLGGMAPTCSLEQLIYDCRLMNQALADGPTGARRLRDWLVQGDAGLDPQAYILAPANVIAIAKVIVEAKTPYLAGKAAALATVELLNEGAAAGEVRISEREQPWLDRIGTAVNALPDDENAFIGRMLEQVDTTRFIPAEYGL